MAILQGVDSLDLLRQQLGDALSVSFPLNCAPAATIHNLPLLSIGEGQRLVEHNGIDRGARSGPLASKLAVLARFRGGGGSERRVVALASAAARLMRAYSGQVETLRRLRHGGDQHVRVEHIHINEGAQAVIGTVRAPDRRHDATTGVPSQDQQIDSDCKSTR